MISTLRIVVTTVETSRPLALPPVSWRILRAASSIYPPAVNPVFLFYLCGIFVVTYSFRLSLYPASIFAYWAPALAGMVGTMVVGAFSCLVQTLTMVTRIQQLLHRGRRPQRLGLGEVTLHHLETVLMPRVWVPAAVGVLCQGAALLAGVGASGALSSEMSRLLAMGPLGVSVALTAVSVAALARAVVGTDAPVVGARVRPHPPARVAAPIPLAPAAVDQPTPPAAVAPALASHQPAPRPSATHRPVASDCWTALRVPARERPTPAWMGRPRGCPAASRHHPSTPVSRT